MGATTLTHVTTNVPNNKITAHNQHQHGSVVDEVEGVLRVYRDGHVERSPIVPCVGPSLAPELGVACSDVLVDKFTSVWARLYVPKSPLSKLPLLVYFHGGGFCVGSASWSCYHDFLAKLSARSRCVIMSVNYRLAPENPLPAAYDDGVKAVLWLKQHANPNNYRDRRRSCNLWARQCHFGRIFLAGDSAGGNIAHRVAAMLDRSLVKPLNIEGTILIQPFFGGEARTESERRVAPQRTSSVLSLAASDAYWRLALPRRANRDHPFCNPSAEEAAAEEERMMVCVAEMDILRDREMEFCDDVERSGERKKKVERVVYRGVGHAFQILGRSQIAQTRTHELMSHIYAFIHHLS